MQVSLHVKHVDNALPRTLLIADGEPYGQTHNLQVMFLEKGSLSFLGQEDDRLRIVDALNENIEEDATLFASTEWPRLRRTCSTRLSSR
jgi:hypothetical protein